MTKKRILSGLRPTGKVHLGHLLGALENWVGLQDEYECFYVVVDWHALMSEYKDPSRISVDTYDNVADWIACGIDPAKSIIFRQSDVPEHAELHLILSCITPLAWLERCPTYKEQLKELANKEVNTYAFLGYPVLQAADILLYKGQVVPVGEDQLPHLELTREIARRFNYLYAKSRPPVFPEPQAKLTKTSRLLGLDRRKMSKSYGNAINLSDSPDEIRKKVQTMFTDPKRIKLIDPGHPEECNVYSYHCAFNKSRSQTIGQACPKAALGCKDCKQEIGEVLIKRLAPIQAERARILSQPGYVAQVLKDGTAQARRIAQATIRETKEAIGLKT